MIVENSTAVKIEEIRKQTKMYTGWEGMLASITGQIKIMFILMTAPSTGWVYSLLFVPFFVVIGYITFPYIWNIASVLIDFLGKILSGLASAGIWGIVTGLLVGIIGGAWIASMVSPIFKHLTFTENLSTPCIPSVEFEKGYVKETCPILSKQVDIDRVKIINPSACELGKYLIEVYMPDKIRIKEVDNVRTSFDLKAGEMKIYTLTATISRLANCGKNNTYEVKLMNRDLKNALVAAASGILEVSP